MSVTEEQIAAAGQWLTNVEALAAACDQTGFPFYLGCTILQKETGGANIFGHDRGGAFSESGHDIEVTKERYQKFRELIRHQSSNGVGPMQITFRGFFDQMEQQGLQPWVPADNIRFGISVLHRTWSSTGSFYQSAKAYNGGDAYAQDAVERAKTWKQRVGTDDVQHSVTEDWSRGDVYVAKLCFGTMASDSVRRLQHVLNQRDGATALPTTGNYLELTDAAVRSWQASVHDPVDDEHASSVGPQQAHLLFSQPPYRLLVHSHA